MNPEAVFRLVFDITVLHGVESRGREHYCNESDGGSVFCKRRLRIVDLLAETLKDLVHVRLSPRLHLHLRSIGSDTAQPRALTAKIENDRIFGGIPF